MTRAADVWLFTGHARTHEKLNKRYIRMFQMLFTHARSPHLYGTLSMRVGMQLPYCKIAGSSFGRVIDDVGATNVLTFDLLRCVCATVKGSRTTNYVGGIQQRMTVLPTPPTSLQATKTPMSQWNADWSTLNGQVKQLTVQVN